MSKHGNYRLTVSGNFWRRDHVRVGVALLEGTSLTRWVGFKV